MQCSTSRPPTYRTTPKGGDGDAYSIHAIQTAYLLHGIAYTNEKPKSCKFCVSNAVNEPSERDYGENSYRNVELKVLRGVLHRTLRQP